MHRAKLCMRKQNLAVLAMRSPPRVCSPSVHEFEIPHAYAGMFGFFFTKGPVNCFEDATKADTAKFGRFHRGMLERGVYLAPSAYEVTHLIPVSLSKLGAVSRFE